jgi:hypothetical protein
MKYRDIDKFIARFALSKGYTVETARKRLLWKSLENERILVELVRVLRDRLDAGVWIGALGRTLDGKKKASNEV